MASVVVSNPFVPLNGVLGISDLPGPRTKIAIIVCVWLVKEFDFLFFVCRFFSGYKQPIYISYDERLPHYTELRVHTKS